MKTRPYTEALAVVRAPLGGERAEVETVALRLATARSGAFFGDIARLAQLAVELGAEKEALQAKLDAFLRVYDRPYLTKGHWSTDLDQAVRGLRGAQ